MELKRYLRVVASTGDDDDDYSMVEISNRRAREAADRIERLEAALRELSEGWPCCSVSQTMRDIARKALEGRDE